MSAVKFASAAYWRNRYLLALPLDSATYPNYVLVYNTLTNSWSGSWTNWQPMCWTRRLDGETEKLSIGHADGGVTDFLDFTDESNETTTDYEDRGEIYTSAVESRAFTCGDQDTRKTGVFVRTEFKKSQADVGVSIIAGRDETPQLLDSFSTDNASLILPFTLPATLPSGGFLPKSFPILHIGQWRELRVRIEAESHKMALNKISVGAFIDSYVLEE